MRIHPVIILLRPWQWLKNVFVFLPMFFGGVFFNIDCWQNGLIAFVAFSLISSAIYCLNDIIDIESDKLHPEKRERPIASGKVSVGTAWFLIAVLTVSAFFTSCLINAQMKVSSVLAGYFLLNVAYCIKLKQYAIVDVFVVSFGFVLRLFVGGFACGVELSTWIVCMSFLLALFLAFAKRRDDIILYERDGIVTRHNILRYNIQFMNQTLSIIGSVTIVCYMMYAISPEVMERFGSRYVYSTSIFVLAGILRYLQVAMVDMKSGSPTKVLLRDHFIQVCVLCWVSSFVIIIYI